MLTVGLRGLRTTYNYRLSGSFEQGKLEAFNSHPVNNFQLFRLFLNQKEHMESDKRHDAWQASPSFLNACMYLIKMDLRRMPQSCRILIRFDFLE
jgi:hypothetical protein